MSMRDELAALIHEHETRYERVSENDWRWACSCDEAYVPIFESWQDCKSQTERHWAEKLTERIERHVTTERAALKHQRKTGKRIRDCGEAACPACGGELGVCCIHNQ